jgi:thiol:disulfide interchange protein
VKKMDIVLICLVLGLVVGCKKKAVEPQPVQLPPVAVSTSEVALPTKTETVPATEVQPQAATEAVRATVNTESVPVAASQPVSTDRPVWMTDYEAAKKRAAAEDKDLLLDFTGSDWCPGCIQLEKEVLSQKIFIFEAQKHFVFMRVDFPRKTKLSALLQQQNEKLAQQYSIEVFPTVILADSSGKPYAEATYEGGGPLNYVLQLAKLQQKKPAK